MRSKSIVRDGRNRLYVYDCELEGNKKYFLKIPGPIKVLDAKFLGKTAASGTITISVLNDRNPADLVAIAGCEDYELTVNTPTGTPVALMSITTGNNAYAEAQATPVVGADTAANRIIMDEVNSILHIVTSNVTYTSGNHLLVYYTDVN